MMSVFYTMDDTPGAVTPNQARELQTELNAIMSNPEQKRNILVLPPSDAPSRVTLRAYATQYEDLSLWLECPCGWALEVSAREAEFRVSLAGLRGLSRHECASE